MENIYLEDVDIDDYMNSKIRDEFSEYMEKSPSGYQTKLKITEITDLLQKHLEKKFVS